MLQTHKRYSSYSSVLQYIQVLFVHPSTYITRVIGLHFKHCTLNKTIRTYKYYYYKPTFTTHKRYSSYSLVLQCIQVLFVHPSAYITRVIGLHFKHCTFNKTIRTYKYYYYKPTLTTHKRYSSYSLVLQCIQV